MKSTQAKILISLSGILILLCAFWIAYEATRHEPPKVVSVAHWISHRTDVSNAVVVIPKSKYAATTDADPSLAGFHYAPGWPVQLPGAVISTPVIADLLGDGHLEV